MTSGEYVDDARKGNIFFVMTWRVGFSEWKNLNICARETTLLKQYFEHGWNVVIITTSELDFLNNEAIEAEFPYFDFIFISGSILRKQNIRVLKNLNSRFSLDKNKKVLPNIIRTNQLLGSHLGVIIKKLIPAVLVIRQGFNAVDEAWDRQGYSIFKKVLIYIYEKIVVKSADALEFTSQLSLESTTRRNPFVKNAYLTPNFVDLDFWEFDYEKSQLARNSNTVKLGYFGRLVPQKNLKNL